MKPACADARDNLLEELRGRSPREVSAHYALHRQGCAECLAFERSERALDRALSTLPRRPAPEALRARLREQLERDTRASGGVERWRSRAIAVTSALALGAVIVLLATPGKQPVDVLSREAVNDHLRVLYAARTVEVESGGIHQVKPWFEGRVDFAPVLPFAGDDEFPLVGGSVGYYLDRKAATFVFKRRLHLVTVFVFRADGLPWPLLSGTKLGRVNALTAQSRGFTSVLFRDGDLGYAVVSDIDAEAVQRLAKKIVEANAHE